MPEYTYKDIIIDPEDPRVEIGAKYWFGVNPRDCIDKANSGKLAARLDFIEDSEKPFGQYSSGAYPICFPCMIHKKELKKEPKKKWVPFDLSKPEVRNSLRGKWFYYPSTDSELMIDCFSHMDSQWRVHGLTADQFLNACTFLDGTPCGQEVTEA